MLNANYLKELLKEYYELPYDVHCMHEFVISGNRQKAMGVKTLDISKRLLDFGMHAPTNYFPLIVPEAMMIEPTETESRETLDHFAEVMKQIAAEAKRTPRLSHRPRTIRRCGGWTRLVRPAIWTLPTKGEEFCLSFEADALI